MGSIETDIMIVVCFGVIMWIIKALMKYNIKMKELENSEDPKK